MTEAQKDALRKYQEAMGEVPASEKKESSPKPEHEKKGFFGGKKKK